MLDAATILLAASGGNNNLSAGGKALIALIGGGNLTLPLQAKPIPMPVITSNLSAGTLIIGVPPSLSQNLSPDAMPAPRFEMPLPPSLAGIIKPNDQLGLLFSKQEAAIAVKIISINNMPVQALLKEQADKIEKPSVLPTNSPRPSEAGTEAKPNYSPTKSTPSMPAANSSRPLAILPAQIFAQTPEQRVALQQIFPLGTPAPPAVTAAPSGMMVANPTASAVGDGLAKGDAVAVMVKFFTQMPSSLPSIASTLAPSTTPSTIATPTMAAPPPPPNSMAPTDNTKMPQAPVASNTVPSSPVAMQPNAQAFVPSSVPQQTMMVAAPQAPEQAAPPLPPASLPSAPASQPNMQSIMPPSPWVVLPPIDNPKAPLPAIPTPFGSLHIMQPVSSPNVQAALVNRPLAMQIIPMQLAGMDADIRASLPTRETSWPAMQQLVQMLSQMQQPSAQAFLATRMPVLGAMLLAAGIDFLQQIKQGSLPEWLGDEVMQLVKAQSNGEALLARLARDFSSIQGQWAQAATGSDSPWQSAILPLFWEGDIEPVTLFMRKRAPEKQDNGCESHRFMIDLQLSHFGPMQFDGLYKQWPAHHALPSHEAAHRQLSLSLRTVRPLEEDVAEGIKHLFLTSMEAMRLHGTIHICHDEPFAMAEAPPSGIHHVLQTLRSGI